MEMLSMEYICTSEKNEPETLVLQCFKFIVVNLYKVFAVSTDIKSYALPPGQALPRELCESLIKHCQLAGVVIDNPIVGIFENLNNTSLRRVHLRNSTISDDGLETLLKHRLHELDIAQCKNVSHRSLETLNKYGDRLVSLVVGTGANLIPDSLYYAVSSTSDSLDPPLVHDTNRNVTYAERGYILRTPNLRRLSLHNMHVYREKCYFQILLGSLSNLTELDLSGCSDVGNLEYIVHLKHLTSLTLHNVFKIQDSFFYICQLKELRHLDISQSSDRMGFYTRENEALAGIVESLPKLESLDISGTNLAGRGVAGHDARTGTDIPGLASRINRPLEFLGLYGTYYGACRRHDIPARHISGDANERQILVAATAYLERPDVLQRVLNDLYQLFRYENCQDIKFALAVVLEAMNRHLKAKHIQISGSATLFYIVKNKDVPPLCSKTRRAVITTLLNGMNTHRDDDTMMRNGCLTLCQFKIPPDVLFEYKRLVNILLHIVSGMEQEGFVQRIGIYLLNSLACQVDVSQKQLLGNYKAINTMLRIIKDRVRRGVCDDVLEVAWSTMWNVTDETPYNCLQFLEGNGMQYFLDCLRLFPDKDELMRNMMGLLGNVAEVKHLRVRLVTPVYISVFTDLVDSTSDGIEVSYNAAGVLSHIASDGDKAWIIDAPPRAVVLNRMVAAIERWSLSSERNINYRSFEPILNLAKVFHTPECQHWAVWALANLTTVYPDKYCSLVESEGGLKILNEVINDPKPYPRIKELASVVINRCEAHMNAMSAPPSNPHELPQLDG